MSAQPPARALTERVGGAWLAVMPVVLVGGALAVWAVRSLAASAPLAVGSADGWPLLIARTALLAGGSALVATGLGLALALLVEGYGVRGRRWLLPVGLLPFLMPPAVATCAVHALLAGTAPGFLTRGAGIVLLVQGWQLAPLIAWGVTRALAARPAAERASLAFLRPGPATWRVLLPAAWPAAVRLGALAFFLLLPAREVAGYGGIETVGDRILASFTATGNEREGWALTAFYVVLALPALALAARAFAPAPALVHGAGAAPGRTPSGIATLLAWAWVLSWLVPLGLLALVASDGARGLLGFAAVRPWLVGLGIEVLRATLLATVLLACGWYLAQTTSRAARVLVALPLFLPGCLIPIALLESVQPLLPDVLLDVPLLLSLGQCARFGAIGLILAQLALATVPRPERLAALQLAPRARRRHVLWPRTRPMLLPALALIAALVLADVEIASLLAPPGHVVPVVELHQFLHFRYDAHAAQLALALTMTILALVGLLGWAAKTDQQ